MPPQKQLPEFSSAEWYLSPDDHRCPHDAWLETIEIVESARGERAEKRKTQITIRLLGAYHDGHLIFRYSNVGKFSIAGNDSTRGLGDWLDDRFSITGNSMLRHDITWCCGSNNKSAWWIEAEAIDYEWIPMKS